MYSESKISSVSYVLINVDKYVNTCLIIDVLSSLFSMCLSTSSAALNVTRMSFTISDFNDLLSDLKTDIYHGVFLPVNGILRFSPCLT